MLVGWFIVFNATFKQYFSYIMTASFIGGGNRSTCTQRKPLTRHKSPTTLSKSNTRLENLVNFYSKTENIQIFYKILNVHFFLYLEQMNKITPDF